MSEHGLSDAPSQQKEEAIFIFECMKSFEIVEEQPKAIPRFNLCRSLYQKFINELGDE